MWILLIHEIGELVPEKRVEEATAPEQPCKVRQRKVWSAWDERVVPGCQGTTFQDDVLPVALFERRPEARGRYRRRPVTEVTNDLAH